MAKEEMKFGEGFSVTKVSGASTPPETKLRHHLIGWGGVLAIMISVAVGAVSFCSKHEPTAPVIHETPSLSEGFSTERTQP